MSEFFAVLTAALIAGVGGWVLLQERLHFIVCRRTVLPIAVLVLIPMVAAVALFFVTANLPLLDGEWQSFARAMACGFVAVGSDKLLHRSPRKYTDSMERWLLERSSESCDYVARHRFVPRLIRHYRLPDIVRQYYSTVLRPVDGSRHDRMTVQQTSERLDFVTTFYSDLVAAWDYRHDEKYRQLQYEIFVSRLLKFGEQQFLGARLSEASRWQHPLRNRKDTAPGWSDTPPPLSRIEDTY